jgi:plastocyanin
MGGGGASTGGGGAGGAGGTACEGGAAATDPDVNGCTVASAVDMTGVAAVDLAYDDPVAGSNKCVRVSAGTAVTWSGDFGAHPLQGGVAPFIDPCSVITEATPAGGIATVTFENVGVYPFFCNFHPDTMAGVIYVDE